MLETLPQSILDELRAAQSKTAKKANRLRVESGGKSYKVISATSKGFVLHIEDAPKLRGLVDLFDGGRHISQCLIVAASQNGDQMHYDFKRSTAASDGAPLDFVRAKNAPIALLGN